MSEVGIREYFQQDHNRLDALFVKFQQCKRSDPGQAKEYFKEFKFGLQRHIVWEEDILFPCFERKAEMGRPGPTDVMRMEHREIKGFLESIHEKVKTGDPESDAEEAQLLSLLGQHNLKEENILYPGIDHLIDADERTAIFEQMEEIPAERYEHCCAVG